MVTRIACESVDVTGTQTHPCYHTSTWSSPFFWLLEDGKNSTALCVLRDDDMNDLHEHLVVSRITKTPVYGPVHRCCVATRTCPRTSLVSLENIMNTKWNFHTSTNVLGCRSCQKIISSILSVLPASTSKPTSADWLGYKQHAVTNNPSQGVDRSLHRKRITNAKARVPCPQSEVHFHPQDTDLFFFGVELRIAHDLFKTAFHNICVNGR